MLILKLIHGSKTASGTPMGEVIIMHSLWADEAGEYSIIMTS